MKLLSIYYTHKPGGLCKRLYRFLDGAAAQGASVHFATLDTPPALGPLVVIHRIPFPLRRRRGLLFWTLFISWAPFYLLFLTLRLRPNVIAVFGAFYSALAHPASLLGKCPVVLFLRALVFKIDEITERPRFVRSIARLVDRWGICAATKVICMTETMKAEASDFSGRIDGFSVLPNDIARSSAKGESNLKPHIAEAIAAARRRRDVILLTAGVLDRRKNVDALLDAISVLSASPPSRSFVLLVAGDGPLKAQHMERCRKLGQSNVEFLGWVDDMPALFAVADVVVHPSLHEGMPNVVSEALAHELPILASDIPEHREILAHHEILFPLADPATLAKKLREIIEDSNIREMVRALCAERAERFRFNWEEQAWRLVRESAGK